MGGAFDAYSKPLVTMTYETLKDHPLIDATTIGLKGSPTKVKKSFTPPRKEGGLKIKEETPEESAKKLYDLLKDKGII